MASEASFSEAIRELRAYHVVTGQALPPGAPPGAQIIYGRLNTLSDLVSALIEDIRIFRIEGKDFEKLSMCISMEHQQRNPVALDMPPKEAVAEYRKRLTIRHAAPNDPQSPNVFNEQSPRHPSRSVIGWDYVRPALQLTIRNHIMAGLMKNAFNGPGEGCQDLRDAIEIIEEAQRTWPDVDGSIRGRTLEETFLRGVKVALGESMIAEYLRGMPSATKTKKQKHLRDIMALGESLLESFARKPAPDGGPQGEDKDYRVYYPHYCYPRDSP